MRIETLSLVIFLLLTVSNPLLSRAVEPLSIQGLSAERTAEFVNGLAMAFTLYDINLEMQKKPRLFCLPPGKTVGARQVWELASSALEGSHKKQIMAIAALDELRKRFPCSR